MLPESGDGVRGPGTCTARARVLLLVLICRYAANYQATCHRHGDRRFGGRNLSKVCQ